MHSNSEQATTTATTPATTPLTASERRAAALAAKLPAGKQVKVQASKAPAKAKVAKVAAPAPATKPAPVHVRATVLHNGVAITGRRVWFTHAHPTKKGWVQGHTVVANSEWQCEAPAKQAGEGGKYTTTGPKVRAARVAPLATPAKPASKRAKPATKPASKPAASK